jgi:hypothetical protein
MARRARRQRTQSLPELPHDVLLTIFPNLDFQQKITAGLVCKHWNEVLKTSTPSPRLWEVEYDVDAILSRLAFTATYDGHVPEDLIAPIVRYVAIVAPCLVMSI